MRKEVHLKHFVGPQDILLELHVNRAVSLYKKTPHDTTLNVVGSLHSQIFDSFTGLFPLLIRY